MGLLRPSREQRGPDPHLDLKLALFGIGALLGLVGMFTDRRWLVVVAIAVLIAGMLLRFLPRRTDEGDEETGTTPPPGPPRD